VVRSSFCDLGRKWYLGCRHGSACRQLAQGPRLDPARPRLYDKKRPSPNNFLHTDNLIGHTGICALADAIRACPNLKEVFVGSLSDSCLSFDDHQRQIIGLKAMECRDYVMQCKHSQLSSSAYGVCQQSCGVGQPHMQQITRSVRRVSFPFRVYSPACNTCTRC
jgi:hypothetical protein